MATVGTAILSLPSATTQPNIIRGQEARVESSPTVISGFEFIQDGAEIKDSLWKLKLPLAVEISKEGVDFVAISHIIDEYGIGPTVELAKEDLLGSLSDYRAFLEKRENRLADKPKRDLDELRKLLERKDWITAS